MQYLGFFILLMLTTRDGMLITMPTSDGKYIPSEYETIRHVQAGAAGTERPCSTDGTSIGEQNKGAVHGRTTRAFTVSQEEEDAPTLQ
jgi:hypothetical protein